uniref:Uncharacterized protein n=1 Tax=Anopheles farauti TaxID=69004 RepID=A0A182QTX0_9DIPT
MPAALPQHVEKKFFFPGDFATTPGEDIWSKQKCYLLLQPVLMIIGVRNTEDHERTFFSLAFKLCLLKCADSHDRLYSLCAGEEIDDIEENLQYVGGTTGAVALTAVAAATAYYYSTRPVPEKPLVPLDNQCPIEVAAAQEQRRDDPMPSDRSLADAALVSELEDVTVGGRVS